MTPSEIRTAATAYNAAYPEAAEDIAAGSPVVRVFVQSGMRNSHRITLSRHVGIVTADGGFIGAGEPEAFVTNAPKYGATKLATWFGGKAASAGVPVEVVRR
jgi:hypothetical protein